MIELQRCTDREQWDDYILDNGGHPLQLWAWGQVKMGHGWKAERIFAYDDEKIVGAAQVLIRHLPLPFGHLLIFLEGRFLSLGQKMNFLIN